MTLYLCGFARLGFCAFVYALTCVRACAAQAGFLFNQGIYM